MVMLLHRRFVTMPLPKPMPGPADPELGGSNHREATAGSDDGWARRTGPTHRRARIRNRSSSRNRDRQPFRSPATTSPASFYLRDTLRIMPAPVLPEGPVAMLANSSPSGAMKRSKDGPLGTSTEWVPVQSALTV